MSRSGRPALQSPDSARPADPTRRTNACRSAPKLLGAVLAVYAIWLAYLGAVAFVTSGP